MLEFYAVKVTKVKDGDTFVGDIKMGSFGMTLHGKDSFGRWITDVYIDGDLNTRLNDMLMKEGLAKLYKRGE